MPTASITISRDSWTSLPVTTNPPYVSCPYCNMVIQVGQQEPTDALGVRIPQGQGFTANPGPGERVWLRLEGSLRASTAYYIHQGT